MVLTSYLATIREKLQFEWRSSRACMGFLLYLYAKMCLLAGRNGSGLEILSKLYGSGMAPRTDPWVLSSFRFSLKRGWVESYVRRNLSNHLDDPRIIELSRNPSRLLGTRMLVMKPASGNERGLVAVDYNFVFPILIAKFDLDRIAEKYDLYAEPSWTGLLDDHVLYLTLFPGLVVCAAYEPRDFEALASLGSNIVPVRLGANCFVDDSVFVPIAVESKEYDLIMVAAWASYKLHRRFLASVAKLRDRVPGVRVALVGYPQDLSRLDIERYLREFDLEEHVDLYENISPEEVRRLLCLSSINVLWSRREGTPRTPLEGLFCDVPLILRKGFNYGFDYDFVNDQTGAFADEETFSDVVVDMLGNYQRYSPRQWIMRHMSAKVSTDVLEDKILSLKTDAGEPWSGDLAVRFSRLDAQQYAEPSAMERFREDYKFLASCVRA